MIQVLNKFGLDCPELETLSIKDQTLTTESQFLLFKCLELHFLLNMKYSVLVPHY